MMPFPAPRRPDARAFTIIEMLIVVSIIVLLVAFLLPALKAARDQGKKAVCRSNLKAVGDGMGLYLGDWNDVYPAGDPPENFDLFGAAGATTTTAVAARPLNKYLNDAVNLAKCPLDAGLEDSTSDHAWQDHGSSYIYPNRASFSNLQSGFTDGIWQPEGLRKSLIRWEANKLLVADIVVMTSSYGIDVPQHHWHTSRDPMQVNALFADGHAEDVRRKTENNELTPTIAGPAGHPEEKYLGTDKDYY